VGAVLTGTLWRIAFDLLVINRAQPGAGRGAGVDAAVVVFLLWLSSVILMWR
jgi:hypothetical protein